jgi:hypothetical protein
VAVMTALKKKMLILIREQNQPSAISWQDSVFQNKYFTFSTSNQPYDQNSDISHLSATL